MALISMHLKRVPAVLIGYGIQVCDKQLDLKYLHGFSALNIESSRDWIDCYEVPFHMCPALKRNLASQAGQSSFGKFRDNLIYVKEHVSFFKRVLKVVVFTE